jgi:hypothetical protein
VSQELRAGLVVLREVPCTITIGQRRRYMHEQGRHTLRASAFARTWGIAYQSLGAPNVREDRAGRVRAVPRRAPETDVASVMSLDLPARACSPMARSPAVASPSPGRRPRGKPRRARRSRRPARPSPPWSCARDNSWRLRAAIVLRRRLADDLAVGWQGRHGRGQGRLGWGV